MNFNSIRIASPWGWEGRYNRLQQSINSVNRGQYAKFDFNIPLNQEGQRLLGRGLI